MESTATIGVDRHHVNFSTTCSNDNEGNDFLTCLFKKQKTTSQIHESLGSFSRSLQCGICREIMVEPATLACTHSFCKLLSDSQLDEK